jgi:hypothetical protein
MTENPHISNAQDWQHGEEQPSAFALQNAQIEATLAVAWETARLADEQRTANLIAVEQGQYAAFMQGALNDDGRRIWQEAGAQLLERLGLEP